MAHSHVIKSGDIFCKSTFLDDDIFFTILAGKHGYSGQLDSEVQAQIEAKFAGKYGSVQELAEKTFTSPSEQFLLSVEENQLIWKKCGGKAKLRLAAISLKEMSLEDVQTELMDFLLTSSLQANEKLVNLESLLEQKTKDLTKAKALNEKFAKEKEESEAELIEQFLPILNAKKRRIAELEGIPQEPMESDNLDPAEEDFAGSTDDEDGEEENRGEKRKPAKQSEGAKKSLKLDDEHLDDSESLLKDDD